MNIKLHITGYAVAYEPMRLRKTAEPSRKTGRPQGSLYSQQKHAIADAVEWIRTHCTFKPRIFVATTPGFLDHAKEGKFISKLVHNLKNGWGMINYVWVREFTGNGFPHFHFVADVDQFDAVKLSVTWSRYFGSDAKNSIRVGTKPNGRRKYWIDNKRMSWYMTKYIGKGVGDTEKNKSGEQKYRFRTFAISQEAREKSQPLTYVAELQHTYRNTLHRSFVLSENDPHYSEAEYPHTFNPHGYRWKWTGNGQTYTGFPKQDRKKSQ